ncbi:MAG: hypothetical protein PHO32_10585, partial [Candidatus Cloacimonetes bacterium]|nr:hypothetical protein [Candidatus Cloacimonadota bacterium]
DRYSCNGLTDVSVSHFKDGASSIFGKVKRWKGEKVKQADRYSCNGLTDVSVSHFKDGASSIFGKVERWKGETSR